MIKTFVNESVVLLDQEVNDAMSEHCKNLPVRTETFVLNGKVVHKATLFFDYDFKMDESGVQKQALGKPYEYPANKAPGTSKKIGALWLQKTGGITGVLNEQKVVVPPMICAEIIQGQKWKGMLYDLNVSVIANKFKMTALQPDFVIFPGV